MRSVHVLLPAGVDDPTRPSGGNVYDLRVCRELTARAWHVVRHEVAGQWPDAGEVGRASTVAALAALPDDALVLVDGLVGSPVGDLLAAAATRLRLVLLVHLPLGEGRSASDPLAGLERTAVTASAGLVGTSGWTADWLVQHAGADPDRVTVARPGTDPAPLAAGRPGGSRLLTVGALAPVKGQDRILTALAGVRDLDWRWRCVGPAAVDPAYARGLQASVAAAGLGERVSFAGPVGAAALDQAYAACDLLVVGSRQETYGMVVGEALARGIPVVVPPVGGLPEALGSDEGSLPGMLAETDDEAGLGEALRTWLTDRAVRDRARAAARSRRATLPSWTATADAVERALRRAAEDTG